MNNSLQIIKYYILDTLTGDTDNTNDISHIDNNDNISDTSNISCTSNISNNSNNIGNTSNNIGNTSNNIGNTSNNIGNTSNNIGDKYHNIRFFIDYNNEIWFVGEDIEICLQYDKNDSPIKKYINDFDKIHYSLYKKVHKIRNNIGSDIILINEPGLYILTYYKNTKNADNLYKILKKIKSMV